MLPPGSADPITSEGARQKALGRLELLDSPPDAELDRLVALTARSLGLPICLISLVDHDRLWIKASFGVALVEVPRLGSPCDQVVGSNEPWVCPDLSLSARHAPRVSVQGRTQSLRFYAGVPLRTQGDVIGTVCVFDLVARPDFGAEQLGLLGDFAHAVSDAIVARKLRLAAQRERDLFTDGPFAAVTWEGVAGAMRIKHRSQNLAPIVGAEVAMALGAGTALPDCVDPRDAKAVQEALLEPGSVRFRLKVDGRWLQLVTVGDRDEAGRLWRMRGYLSDASRKQQLEETIEATRERLELAMESARIGAWDMDILSLRRLCSPRVAAMLGLSAQEMVFTADEWHERVHPFDLPGLKDSVTRCTAMSDAQAEAHGLFTVEYRVRHRLGHHIWVQSCARLVKRDPLGRPARMVGTLMDITETKAAQELRSRQQKLLNLVNTTQRTFLQDKDLRAACDGLFEPLLALTESRFGFIGICEQAEGGQAALRVPSVANLHWDTASLPGQQRHRHVVKGLVFTELDNLFGYTLKHNTVVCANDAPNHPGQNTNPPGFADLQNFLGIPLRHDGKVLGLLALSNRPDGYEPALAQMLEPLTLTLGTLIHARAVEEERDRVERQLVQQATADALTGLANRRRFFDVSVGLLAQCRRYGAAATVALMDLDHFKQVNDRHGHAMGDAVLKAFAAVLQEVLRESDLAARIGGEEFAVLLPSTTAEGARLPLERIRQLLAERKIRLGEREVSVSVSIGVCEWREDLTSPDAWLAQADLALYAAKNSGRNRLCVADATGAAGASP